jgi:hypothetical protein
MKSNMKKGVKITTKDNIVFDAENTLQDVFGINDFTPVKLHVDYERYNKITKDGEDFLKNFNAALSWVYSNHVDADTLSVREFSLDMMLEFERVFMEQNSKLIKLDVSFEKLLNLLDVDISMLKEFQYKHSENIGIQAFFTNRDGEADDTLNVRIDIEDFTTYTKNQKENDMLEAADNLMVALKEVERFAKVYPLTITQGISSFLLFDMRENKYRVNTTFMT